MLGELFGLGKPCAAKVPLTAVLLVAAVLPVLLVGLRSGGVGTREQRDPPAAAAAAAATAAAAAALRQPYLTLPTP